ncbi:MAG TPA: U32 family peptidase [Acholeplasmataceae bacterium]|nr:U32 family peptidase [Acholeplasmataceae bacterium]
MIELLAPAGDLEKLKYALIYGADAVYIGGNEFSLRARASNFTIETIKEGVKFAHQLGKKVYVTTNIIPHEEDILGLVEYLKALEEANVDAIICASPLIIKTAIKHTNLEIHLSTQQSAINNHALLFWKDYGVKRVVLGRELTLDEINQLSKDLLDIEVFIHGGMCMSFSGRCSLSNTLTNRDANRGGCAHSCRWQYLLYNNCKLISEEYFSMSSKDLMAIKAVPKLIDIGVKSLKVEGRMKSLHYIATVIKTYRMLIDEYLTTGKIKDTTFYEDEIYKAENRLTDLGYFDGNIGPDKQLYEFLGERPNQAFIGLVEDYNLETMVAKIEQRNYFKIGDTIEVFSPNEPNKTFVLDNMLNEDLEEIEVARHAKQIVYIKLPFNVSKYSMLRKVL